MRLLAAAVAAVALAAGCSFGSGSGGGYAIDGCERRGLAGHSVARVWNEQLLDAIRRDVPAPTVHARNLFHVSAAMWDAWAAYDPDADGYFFREKAEAEDVQAAREAALSYAAYRILLHRYSLAAGLEQTFSELSKTMEALCYRIDYTRTTGDTPAALGNRIAARVIAIGRNDGAHEREHYADVDYRPANAPLVVAKEPIEMRDPSRWQPLALAQIVAQNGVPIPGRVQRFVGAQWGKVRGFALPRANGWLTFDPGPAPRYGEREFVRQALATLRYSGRLGDDGVTIDISPGARGGNALGTNDGHGHARNPVTGQAYAPNRVPRGDFARALAEFWADGPDSETPPGHWNTIANDVSDAMPALRVRGEGAAVGRLEWDVKLYFALNGALHDAAVAAWGAKRAYDSARPISMIRYLAARGELPTVPGVVERITAASSAPGRRHAGLRAHVGEVAVRAWRGPPKESTTGAAGVGWIPAADWMPYQLATFVTPAFAGYVSGHSTFSHAAAELLTRFTGSSSFPGGLFEWKVEPESFRNDHGPAHELTLQWATYQDAADDAGISRLFGGIHIPADDFAGRRLGFTCGRAAWNLAQHYFDGSARP